ncbi:hypothetical protein MGYG_04980 [Nannizzia gypsea CBS 118893]|uniref:Uncharacterized protein n=1 Tax=Arthroderma gypseum (strain ATCC MYA-4604 / CBS 118893) TaxID=535722 RepID=E4UXY5_ARTGP|nr:hypothetical protein MGYG_04980 [Nannizzia gypsea CBS 118893]EFR01978.1 hypothetical protein MGYG_04980 [Nannizzia gypsea CBS 118893]
MALPALAGGQDGALHCVSAAPGARTRQGGAINRSPVDRTDNGTTTSRKHEFGVRVLFKGEKRAAEEAKTAKNNDDNGGDGDDEQTDARTLETAVCDTLGRRRLWASSSQVEEIEGDEKDKRKTGDADSWRKAGLSCDIVLSGCLHPSY